MNTKAQSLIEVLISAILLVLVSYGLAGLFMAGKKHITHSQFIVTGAETGKYFLDPLQMDVSYDIVADPAKTSCLKTGTNCPGALTIGNIQYSPTYVRTPNVVGDVTKVSLTITWNENN